MVGTEKKIQPNFCSAKSLESNQAMVSLGLRRLYVSSQNWLQPATRFSVNRTRHATSQWRVVASQAKYSTANSLHDPMLPTVPGTNSDPTPLPDVLGSDGTTDWSKSYFGLSAQPFAKEIADVLMARLDPMDVEMKPGKHFPNVSLNFLC